MTTAYGAELLKVFRAAFRGRDDVVPRYWRSKDGEKSGYSPICANEWKEGICKKPCRTCPNPSYVALSDKLLTEHFKGKHILGVYPLLPDGTCWLIAADFDDHGAGGIPRDPFRDATEFQAVCEAQEIPCYLERSKSGKGLHAWIFFDAPVPAWKARLVVFALLREAGVIGDEPELSSFDRLFPNQDEPSGQGFGNLIALPLQGAARKMGFTLLMDPATDHKMPTKDQLEALRSIRRATEIDLDRLTGAWDLKRADSSRANNPGKAALDPLFVLHGVDEGGRDIALFRYACRLRSQGMNRQEAEVLVTAAAARCKPAFPSAEALKKVASAWKHPAPEFSEVSSIEDDHEPDILQWPILPEEALYGLAGDFVRLATRNSEADPAAVLITFLVRFCAEVGNGPFLMVGDSKHYARLFAAIVGDTSKARKGTSYGPVARCFEGITSFCSFTSSNKYVCARSTPGPLSSGEGIIYAVRDPIQKPTWDKKTREVSVEIVDPGVNDKRLFICDEELGGALSCTKREGNTLSTVLRCAWDHGNQDPLTKTSKIAATGAHIGIVGHITLTELKRKLEDSEAFNGFANRFLWVCARRNGCVPFPEPMPDGELREIQRRLFDTITFARGVGQMCLTDEAKALWREIYPDLSADHDGLVGAVINRAEAQVLRLAMVFALIDRSNNINNLHINKCITMYEYCKQSAQYIFHGFEADPVSDRIMKRVRDLGEMDWMDLYALFSNNLSKQSIDAAVNDLLRKGKLTVETLKTGDRGRPKRILRAKHSHTHNSDEQNEVNEVIPDRAIRGYLIDLQRGAVGDPEVRAACIERGYLDEQGRFTQAGFDLI